MRVEICRGVAGKDGANQRTMWRQSSRVCDLKSAAIPVLEVSNISVRSNGVHRLSALASSKAVSRLGIPTLVRFVNGCGEMVREYRRRPCVSR